ncbi:MAG: hypothetical protein JWM81_459 [Candidatus Saccharibacteria bacterium]|nr:hypothetical protein [Candidatus Saccharibacteria bacterium]
MDQKNIEMFGSELAEIDARMQAHEPEVAETDLPLSDRFEALWTNVRELKYLRGGLDVNDEFRFTVFPNGTTIRLEFFVVDREATVGMPVKRGVDITIFYKGQELPVESINDAQIARAAAVEPEAMGDYEKSIVRNLGLMEQTVALARSW